MAKPFYTEAELKAGEAYQDWNTDFIRGYRDAVFTVLTSLDDFYGRGRLTRKKMEERLHSVLRETGAALHLRGEDLIPNLREEE